jgi:hypothetical protein
MPILAKYPYNALAMCHFSIKKEFKKLKKQLKEIRKRVNFFFKKKTKFYLFI